ncbi:MAG: type II toxin-antitoxin system death-on-curing family toxin [Gemmatimonadota bacterium]|nr:type II toxin-antitoxin system death-on-curing family toxin [Gemmatimonadota bacterium]
MNIKFLDLRKILRIHQDQLERYGGTPGLRSRELLESAVAVPMAGFGETYFHESHYLMAAAYLFHIVKNHPFLDGNKRVGAVAAGVFLKINGIDLQADEDEFERLVLDVAEGKADKERIAEFFRANSIGM